MAVEQFQVIQMQLASAEEQIATSSSSLNATRMEAGTAVCDLRKALAAEQQKTTLLQQAMLGRGTSGCEWSLVSAKDFTGGRFSGAKGEAYKPPAKKAKIFFNRRKTSQLIKKCWRI